MGDQKWQQGVPKIEKIDKLEGKGAPTEIQPVPDLDQSKFHMALNAADPTTMPKAQEPAVVTPSPTGPSPIEDMSQASNKTQLLKPPSVEEVINQAEDLRKSLQGPQQQLKALQTAEPRVFSSSLEELQNVDPRAFSSGVMTTGSDKLIHIDSSLRAVLNRTGVEVKAEHVSSPGLTSKPLVHFLNYLTNSNQQMNAILLQLHTMDKRRLGPTELLALQIKIGFIQSELEFFANVVNQAMTSIKTIMNIQV